LFGLPLQGLALGVQPLVAPQLALTLQGSLERRRPMGS